MQIILVEDVRNVGLRGQVKEVAEGYARNFLFPRKLAEAATPQAIERAKKLAEENQKNLDSQVAAAREAAEKLKDIKLSLKEKGDKERLFGSVTAKEIAQELRGIGISVEEKQIVLEEHIKQPGIYFVAIDFGHGVETKVQVVVELE